MSQRTATITSLPMALEVVKAMQAGGLDWAEGYLRWSRLSEQNFRVDRWSLYRG
jgi:hypothetical protein